MKWMIPVNQLDATQERAIAEIVSDVGNDHLVKGFAGSGKTIVLTSHSLELVTTLCERVLWLDHGRVVACGDAKEVVAAYRESPVATS